MTVENWRIRVEELTLITDFYCWCYLLAYLALWVAAPAASEPLAISVAWDTYVRMLWFDDPFTFEGGRRPFLAPFLAQADSA